MTRRKMSHKPTKEWEGPLLCVKCGGQNLHTMMWVDLRTGEVDWSEAPWSFSSSANDAGIHSSHCLDCRDYHGTVIPENITAAVAILAVLCGAPADIACGYCSSPHDTIADAEDCCRDWLDGEFRRGVAVAGETDA